MDPIHLLLVEDKNTKDDRTRFICEIDPRWYDRKGYILNKLLRYLSEKGDVLITSVLDSEVPCEVPPDIDAIVMHIDVSVNEARIIDWTARQSAEHVVINGFSDLRKRAVDEHRPAGYPSTMLPPDATAGWAFVKNDCNYPQAPESVHLRVRVEDIDPALRTRQDLVVQQWIEDYRARTTGLFTTERWTWLLGDLTVGERLSAEAFDNDAYFRTTVRSRRTLLQDMAILERSGLRSEPLPGFWLDDDESWAARRKAIEHYAGALRMDFAGIDAIQIERNTFVVIDINPTPFHSIPMLTLAGEHFVANLRRRINTKKGVSDASLVPEALEAGEWLVHRRKLAAREIVNIVGLRTAVVLVDDNTYPREELAELGAVVRRFFQGDGEYGSRPSDDAGAIAELERLRSNGADYVAFVWSAFWWLKYYPGLHTYLRSAYSCVLDDTRAIVFDLRLRRSRAERPA